MQKHYQMGRGRRSMGRGRSMGGVCLCYSPNPIIHDTLSGGERVIIKFCQLLNARGICSAIFSYGKAPASNIVPFTNSISDDTIVVYSEGIYGNPLNAKRVCRWMLYEPYKRGGQQLINTWDKNDVLCSYGNYDGGLKCDISVSVVDFNEDKFTINNRLVGKSKKYYLIHKALLNGWTQEALDSEIQDLKQSGFEEFRIEQTEKMNETMQDCCVFVSFDLNTYISNIAVLCGALSMIKKSDTVTRTYEEILEKRGSYGSIGIKPFNAGLLASAYNYGERLNDSNMYREYIKTANNIDEFVNWFSL